MRLATGSYSNTFRVMGRQPGAMPDTILEASRDPLRRRLAGPKVTHRLQPTPSGLPSDSAMTGNADKVKSGQLAEAWLHSAACMGVS